jgi:Uma2 family endonuclease
MALPDNGRKYELVEGEAREVPTGGRHGKLGVRIGRILGPFADGHGELFDSSTGFRMASGNIRSPDLSFMRFERLPDGEAPIGFVPGAPDLCIEVISPSEDQRDSWDKVGEYFESGAAQVWHVFPETRRVVVFQSMGDIRTYSGEDTLEPGDLLPGFQCRVTDLFGGAAG